MPASMIEATPDNQRGAIMRTRNCAVFAATALLAGCSLVPSNPQVTIQPDPAGSPAGAGSPSWMPPPPGPDNIAFHTQMTPTRPCPGDTVHLTGTRFIGAQHVTAWLKGDTPEQATIVGSYPLNAVPYAVKLGEANVDAQGNFTLDATLKPEMAPVSTGGRILVQPGSGYTIVLVNDGTDPGTRGIGFSVATDCPAVTPPLPSPASIRLDPAFPCYGAPVTVIGAGFQGPTQTLEFHLAATRFGDGPSKTVQVPVAADGSLHYTFNLEDMLDLRNQPSAQLDARYYLYAFDGQNNRQLSVPIPICNTALQNALQATSIPLSGGMQGEITLPYSASPQPSPAPEDESTVIRSQQDLEAFGARHHLTPQAVAQLPQLDFTKDEGLMVLTGPNTEPEQLEIVAVQQASDGLEVYSVAWRQPSPGAGPLLNFHYLPIPKTDAPVHFAPIALGFLDQRAALAPALANRQYPRLNVASNGVGYLQSP